MKYQNELSMRSAAPIAAALLLLMSACGDDGSSADTDGAPADAAGRANDTGVAIDHDSGEVISSECGDIAEGTGVCVGTFEIRICEGGELVAYECPAGSACDVDPTDPTGIACFCDGQADAICPDAACVNDPDCAPPVDAGPDCTPNPLPAPATNMLASTSPSLPNPSRLAVSDDTVFTPVSYGGQSVLNSRIVACPTSGCPATPTAFGTPNLGADETGVAATADKIFWTMRDLDFPSSAGNVLMSANLDGSEPEVVYQVFDVPVGAISPNLAALGDTLYFDSLRGDSSNAMSTLRKSVAGAASTAVAGTEHAAYAFSKIIAGGGRVAYWVDSVSQPTSDYEIHILENDVEVGTSAMVGTLYGAAMDADHLVYRTSTGNLLLTHGCTLPSCTDLVDDLAMTYSMRGFTVAISDGRLYFASVVDQGCGLGLTGALASCDLDEAFAGTCTPTYHATGIAWVNLDQLVIRGNLAFATTRTSSDLLRVDLSTTLAAVAPARSQPAAIGHRPVRVRVR